MIEDHMKSFNEISERHTGLILKLRALTDEIIDISNDLTILSIKLKVGK